MKRTLSFFLSLVIVFGVITSTPIDVSAAETIASGKIVNSNVYWEVNDEGVATLTGTGAIDNIWSSSDYPFKNLNVKKVVIGQGITKLGWNLFDECPYLEEVVISDTVTTLSHGHDPFTGCPNLKKIYIPKTCTNIPIDTLDDFGINKKYKDLVIYCEKDSVAHKYAEKNKIKFEFVKYEDGLLLENQTFTTRVIDVKGNPIENATVVINSGESVIGTYTTDSDGIAKHTGEFALGNISLTISADGYNTHNSKEDAETISSAHYEAILYKTDEIALRLRSVYYYLSDETYETTTLKRNLLIGSKQLSKSYFGNDYFVIECLPYDKASIQTYTLYQGKKKIASNIDGFFKLKRSMFKVGKDVYILTENSSGERIKTPINFEICESYDTEEYRLEFADEKISFMIPDDIPVVGGTECSFDMPDSPIEFAIEDGKIFFGVNIDLGSASHQIGSGSTEDDNNKEDDNDGEDNNKDSKTESTSEKMKKAQKIMQDFLSAPKEGGAAAKVLEKENYEKLKSILKEQKKSKVPYVGEVEVSVFGSGEVEYSVGLDKIAFEICLVVAYEGETSKQIFIHMVPVTLELSVGVEAQAQAKGTYHFKAKTWTSDLVFKITPEIEPFAGVGVSKIVAVGFYGNAQLPVEIQLMGDSAPRGLKSVDFLAELGFRAYAGPFEYKTDFCGRKWHLYPEVKEFTLDSVNELQEASLAPLYSLSSYSVGEASYLENEWLGASLPADLSKPAALLKGTYNNCQPAIVNNSSATILSFIGADDSKGDGNTATAMYSVYDDAAKSWGTPVCFDTDGTFDTSISVCSHEENIFAVYQNTGVAFDSSTGVDADTYIKNQVISVYRYDDSTQKFVADRNFKFDGEYCRLPKITLIKNVPTITWVSSSNSDIFGQGANNTIYYSQFDGAKWSEPQVLETGVPTIMDYAIGQDGENFGAVIVNDSDNNLETNDTVVNYYANGKSTKILDGDITNLQYVKLPSESAETFVFANGGNICSFNGTESSDVYIGVGSPESLVVLDDKILMTVATDTSSNIYSLNYDSSLASYGTPFAVTNQSTYIEKLTAIEKNGKNIITMANKDVKIDGNAATDNCDLSIMELGELSDIKITGVSYDKENAIPGSTVLMRTAVKNCGSDAVKGITLSITNETGSVIEKTVGRLSIKPGQELVVLFPVTIPSYISSTTELTMHVVETNITDSNMADNSYKLDVNYSDLDVEYEIQKVGSLNSVVLNVTNKGTVATTGVLEVFLNDSETPFKTFNVSELSSQDVESFYVDITAEDLGGTKGTVSFKVTGANEEFYTHNNSDSIYMDISSPVLRAIESIDEDTTIDYENKYIFTSKSLVKDIKNLLFVDYNYELNYADKNIFCTGEELLLNETLGDNDEGYTFIVNGDLNSDGVCDVLDASYAALVASGKKNATKDAIYAANGEIADVIDVEDYQSVVNKAVS